MTSSPFFKMNFSVILSGQQRFSPAHVLGQSTAAARQYRRTQRPARLTSPRRLASVRRGFSLSWSLVGPQLLRLLEGDNAQHGPDCWPTRVAVYRPAGTQRRRKLQLLNQQTQTRTKQDQSAIDWIGNRRGLSSASPPPIPRPSPSRNNNRTTRRISPVPSFTSPQIPDTTEIKGSPPELFQTSVILELDDWVAMEATECCPIQ